MPFLSLANIITVKETHIGSSTTLGDIFLPQYSSCDIPIWKPPDV